MHTTLRRKWGEGICSNIQFILCPSLHSLQSLTQVHAGGHFSGLIFELAHMEGKVAHKVELTVNRKAKKLSKTWG